MINFNHFQNGYQLALIAISRLLSRRGHWSFDEVLQRNTDWAAFDFSLKGDIDENAVVNCRDCGIGSMILANLECPGTGIRMYLG